MEQGRVSSVTMKQTSRPINSKMQQKITYLILYCVKSDSFYLIQIWSLKQYFICENRSKDALNCCEVCEIVMQT